MSVPTGLHEAATSTRRHYAAALQPDTSPNDAIPGLHGAPLCDEFLLVMDDERREAWARIWGSAKPVPLADLPLCKRCERKAAKG